MNLPDTKYINVYRLPNDLSLVLEVNNTLDVPGREKISSLIAYRWDETLGRLQILVETDLNVKLNGSTYKTHQRFDSSDFFIHIIEQPVSKPQSERLDSLTAARSVDIDRN